MGEALSVEEGNRGIIVQIVENSLLDLPGILEEVVRSEITEEKLTKIGSTDYAKYSANIRNMRFARCKIRKEISQGNNGRNFERWAGSESISRVLRL